MFRTGLRALVSAKTAEQTLLNLPSREAIQTPPANSARPSRIFSRPTNSFEIFGQGLPTGIAGIEILALPTLG